MNKQPLLVITLDEAKFTIGAGNVYKLMFDELRVSEVMSNEG